jgi:NAD(P)-dependent dehydrogenase (short-subunit alcohol dehydrogenase family)
VVNDPKFDLSGLTVMVTRGSRGLGYQMVRAFAEHGADVVVASRKLENCRAVAAEVEGLGRRALAVSVHAAKWARWTIWSLPPMTTSDRSTSWSTTPA